MTSPSPASQVSYPWRTTVRTVFQTVLALLAAAPILISTAGLDGGVGAAATFIAVSAAVTRVMALPVVDNLIVQFLPFLAATPKSG